MQVQFLSSLILCIVTFSVGASTNGEYLIRGKILNFDEKTVTLLDKNKKVKVSRKLVEKKYGLKFHSVGNVEIRIMEKEYLKYE